MESVELSSLTKLITKGTTPTSLGKNFVSNGVKFLRAQNVIYGSILINDDILFIDDETHLKELKRSQIENEDILLTIAGTIGRCGIVKNITEPLNCNQAVAIIRLNDSKINASYLCKYLSSDLAKNQFSKGKVSATISNLSLTQVKKLKIPLPPLKEQQRIAHLLDEADKLRQLNQQLIQKYEQLTQSLFLEMFGDLVTNPKGWEIKTFKDVLEIRNGKNQKKVLNPNGKYPIYGSGGIMNYADEYISEANSVIIGRKGNINKPILVKEKYWHVDTAFGLNPIQEKLDYNYLFFFCVRYNFEQHNKTVTIPSLTKATLLNVKIPLPPLDLQTQFAERVGLIEAQKQQVQEALQKSEDLFNSLLQEVFKG